MEAAFVTPMFFLLLFGVIEGGYGLHERLSVANMALVGARSASGNGADVLADFQVLAAVREGAGGVAASQVTTIVVYKTTGPGQRGAHRLQDGERRPVSATTTPEPTWPRPAPRSAASARRRRSRSTAPGAPPAARPPSAASTVPPTTSASTSGRRTATSPACSATGITFASDTVMRIEPRTLI